MKRLTFLMALAAIPFMFGACGDKKANQAKDNDDKSETVEVRTEMDAEPDGDERGDADENEIAAIRRIWASQTLTDVVAGGKADIEQLALAFCMEYPNHMPNKALYDYLRSTTRNNEVKVDMGSEDYGPITFYIDNQKNNGYISSDGRMQCDWLTDCCYWKRNDGHLLAAFWMSEGHESGFQEQSLLFYDYDPDTDSMTPETSLVRMVDDVVGDYDSYSAKLPAEGKDINLYGYMIDDESESAEVTGYLLRWNGYDFDVEQEEEY